jgi:hypothetical protein
MQSIGSTSLEQPGLSPSAAGTTLGVRRTLRLPDGPGGGAGVTAAAREWGVAAEAVAAVPAVVAAARTAAATLIVMRILMLGCSLAGLGWATGDVGDPDC